MTVEDRYILDVGDLKSLRIDCKHCNTSLSFQIADRKSKLPETCPGCHETWHYGGSAQEAQIVNGIAELLRTAAQMADAKPPARESSFRVRFEMDRPV